MSLRSVMAESGAEWKRVTKAARVGSVEESGTNGVDEQIREW
jgi:hypothetical protein